MFTIYQSINPLVDASKARAQHAAAREAHPQPTSSTAATLEDLAALEDRLRASGKLDQVDAGDPASSTSSTPASSTSSTPASSTRSTPASSTSSTPAASVPTHGEERPRGLGRRIVDRLTGGDGSTSTTADVIAAEVGDDASRG